MLEMKCVWWTLEEMTDVMKFLTEEVRLMT